MLLGILEKQPNEKRLRIFSYEDVLPVGDSVVSAELASVSPSGLTADTVVVISPRVSFFVSGGTDGIRYTVTIRSTTSSGEVFEDELQVRVREVS